MYVSPFEYMCSHISVLSTSNDNDMRPLKWQPTFPECRWIENIHFITWASNKAVLAVCFVTNYLYVWSCTLFGSIIFIYGRKELIFTILRRQLILKLNVTCLSKCSRLSIAVYSNKCTRQLNIHAVVDLQQVSCYFQQAIAKCYKQSETLYEILYPT